MKPTQVTPELTATKSSKPSPSSTTLSSPVEIKHFSTSKSFVKVNTLFAHHKIDTHQEKLIRMNIERAQSILECHYPKCFNKTTLESTSASEEGSPFAAWRENLKQKFKKPSSFFCCCGSSWPNPVKNFYTYLNTLEVNDSTAEAIQNEIEKLIPMLQTKTVQLYPSASSEQKP